jgi:SAM-dependent methyltransferase
MKKNESIVLDFFNKRYDAHGKSPAAMAWSERGQSVRFDRVETLLPEKFESLLDVGCGFGDFSRRLNPAVQYEGWDICENFLKQAQQGKNISYQLRDVLTDPPQENSFDVIVGIGAFNVDTGRNLEQAKQAILSMYKGSRSSAIISLLSSLADKEVQEKNPETFFYNPVDIFEYCTTFCRKFDVFHGYFPHDFTLRLLKDE